MKSRQTYKHVSGIIDRFFNNRYPDNLEEDVQKWLVDGVHENEKEHVLHELWNSIALETEGSAETSLRKVKAKLGMEAQTQNLSLARRTMRVAAVVIPLLLIAGTLFYFINRSVPETKTAFVDMGQREITLPDGTQVWLNSGSKLSYPEEFEAKKRNVKLSGEAYFKVTEDKTAPFTAETDYFDVTVVGTEFNVRVYSEDENATVTLIDGRLEIATPDKRKFTLEPDQELVLNKNTDEVQILEVSADRPDITRWMQGDLIFEESTIEDIIRSIERSRNITIEIPPSLLTGEKYSLKFVNNESAEEIIQILALLGDFNYRIEGSKITIF